jgi:hypothetical protein
MTSYLAALVMLFSFAIQGTGPVGLKGKPEDSQKAARAYLSSQKYGDNLPDSQTVYTQFAWSSDFATIKVVPVSNAHRISWQSALTDGGDGYFVAKIYNIDNKDVAPLGLRQGAVGYLWVGALADGTRGAAIYSVGKDGVIQDNPKKLELGGFCAGQHGYAAARFTNGDKCTGSFTQAPSATASIPHPMYMLASTTMMPAMAAGSGLWVSCLGGCCEVRVTQN